MRTRWITLGVCVAAWAGASGCLTTQPDLKPDIPAEYVLPPENDPRFSMPHNYPKETLNTGPVKRFTSPGGPGGGPMGGPRGGPGRMGGSGGMGGGY